MRYAFVFFTSVLGAFFIYSASAEQPKDFAMRLSREIISKGGGKSELRIRWDNVPNTVEIAVYRKKPNVLVWEQIGQIDSNGVKQNINSWAVEDEPAEYMTQRLVKPAAPWAIATNVQNDTVRQFMATGYIAIGYDKTIPDECGTIALIVDSEVAPRIAAKLDRLERDLKSEWWKTIRIIVPRTEKFDGAAVKKVKNLITQLYATEKNNLKSVLLIGRVAVPYSGLIRPDGHPDHLGAWTADAYYGDMDGIWTDATVNDATSASRPANRNIPSDGKFDQSTIPSDIDLAVGRVDFYDMPAFRDTLKHKTLFDSEIALLERYFDKNHAFRAGGSLTVPRRALVDDNFGSYSPEMFASAGWRLAAVCEKDSIRAGKALATLKDKSYMWFYGCGGGSYTSCGGVATSSDFAKQPINAAFTSLFGSYFGDWDYTDNIMRALIAADGQTLTCAWSGRPQWYFHRMGLGATIGDAFLMAINNSANDAPYYPNVYYTQNFSGGIIYETGKRGTHIALIGDPTLRMNMGGIPDGGKLTVTQPGTYTRLEWQPAVDSDVEYIVYRTDSTGNRKLLTAEPLQKTAFYNDSGVTRGRYIYSVYNVKRRFSPSAEYYDANGIPFEAEFNVTGVDEKSNAVAGISLECSPVPITTAANFNVKLPLCASSVTFRISDVSGAETARFETYFNAQPPDGLKFTWDLRSASGKRVAAGVYFVSVSGCGSTVSRPIIIVSE
ncbi:hypothetical protein MASR2M18_07140 [Ignavibacteria bacterium]|nr:hypothetical protein [Bacteroidota bacterium]MCZ2132099.1 hypothetical protein [Bacteroidota bacterium]